MQCIQYTWSTKTTYSRKKNKRNSKSLLFFRQRNMMVFQLGNVPCNLFESGRREGVIDTISHPVNEILIEHLTITCNTTDFIVVVTKIAKSK